MEHFDITDPLPQGTVLLEASAGTGKTWTIAALVARFVAEGEADLRDLLVVTFSRAASQELRARVREDMEKQRQGAAEAALRTSVMDSLIAQTPFDVGPAVVERQLDAQIASLQQRFRGQVPEEVMQEQLQRAREEGQPTAERRVRERLLLDEVAKFCEIEIGDEDLQERLGEMAASQGADLAEFERLAREQGWLEALRAELREERALDWLVGEADVTESA